MTIGTDVFFRTGSFAPHTCRGLWLLAHEVAHVVQQQRGPVSGVAAGEGRAIGSPGAAEEGEADAAADAVLAGQPFEFGPCATTRNARVETIQRFMAWEHLLLGNLDPAGIRSVIADHAGRPGRTEFRELEIQCRLAAELGRSPRNVDPEKLAGQFHGVQTGRLSASGLVLTLGELNVLADYVSHPRDVDEAPAAFILPIVQAIRSQSYRQLHLIAGRRRLARRDRDGLRYPTARTFPDVREFLEIDALGRKCRLPAWKLYSSVLARNAAHFAPHSWYRWQSFHLQARALLSQADTAPAADRAELRRYAQVVAGYADHFLHDSFAAGHLINKTLVMQWYVEWLLQSRLPVADRALLAGMSLERQPYLHEPRLYDPQPGAERRMWPSGAHDPYVVTDPESVAAAGALDEQQRLSGVWGPTPEARDAAYTGYLALLRSSIAQLATRVVHDYFNSRSLVVASCPAGPRYEIRGDRTMLADPEGAVAAVTAAHASRRAIADLLDHGKTGIASGDILASLPSLVEVDGDLLPLREWHHQQLRSLCMNELFRRTRVPRVLLSMRPHLGTPVPPDPQVEHERAGR